MKIDLKKIQQTLTIPPLPQPERLDQVLVKLLPDYSRTQIQSWIETGNILVDDTQVKAKTKVRGGETIAIDVTIQSVCRSEPQAIPLSIVYEDEAIIVVNKPVGLVVHPGAGNSDRTLLNALLHHAPQLQTLPRAGILHRLDKNTSGLLVIAKDAFVLKNLLQQLKKRTITREYQAIVYGKLISGGKVDAPIGRHPIHRKHMAVVETGKSAITHYRVIEKYRLHTRILVRLETGRTHQIRVHMAHIHHPLVGDIVYGGRVRIGKGSTPALIDSLRHFKHQALHAVALGFTHPLTQELVRFEVPLPEDIKQLITVLREDSNGGEFPKKW